MTPTHQQGIILYGPPAAGKDTVTAALSVLNQRCVQFPLLKLGPGRATSYRTATPDDIDALRTTTGDIIWEHHRYGALYVIDRPTLSERLRLHVPVLHLGHPEAIPAVIDADPTAHWLVVQLWCPREVAERRLGERITNDIAERLRVWDSTPRIDTARSTINTAETSAADAARLIDSQLSPSALPN